MALAKGVTAGQLEKREFILKCAAKVFREKGYHAASVRDIAREVGLQEGSLYYHIASKEDLLFQIMYEGVSSLVTAMEGIYHSALPPTQKFTKAIRYLITSLADNLDAMIVVLRERGALSPEHRSAYIAKRDRFEELFQRIVGEGVEKGEFVCPDVKMATFAILAACNGMVEWYSPRGSLSPSGIADRFLVLFFDGLLPR